VVGGVVAADPGRVVFVFPGQGGQWAGMGRELAGVCPVFAERLAECGRALAPFVDWDLAGVLAGEVLADRADVVQPVLWAVMVSLAAVWEAAGVTPDAVVGHSQGEIAAAVVAGVLSLEDGARVVALRSRALRVLAGRGGMVSVAEAADVVRVRIAAWGGRLSVAAVNGPDATVVSGELDALRELAAGCEVAGVRVRVLPVDYASHSAQVDQIRDEVLAVLDGVVPGPAVVPMMSAMTGEWLEGSEAGAGYWYDSLRSPVEFARAVEVLAGAGHRVFVEVSPHPVLTAAIADDARTVTGTLRRDDGGPDRFLTSLANLHVLGVSVDWAAVLGGGRRADLPTYAFQHEHFWPRPAPATGAVALGLAAVNHPLLGAAVELAGADGLVLTGQLSARSQPWLADHAVAGVTVLSGTAFADLAVAAGNAAGCRTVDELTMQVPLVIPAKGAVRVQVTVDGPGPDGRRAVDVYARPAAETGPWTRHAGGWLSPDSLPSGPDGEFTAWPPPGAVPVEIADPHDAGTGGGYAYGPSFRGLRAAWRRGDDLFVEAALPAGADATGFGVHPALLDAVLQAIGLDAANGAGGAEVMLPLLSTIKPSATMWPTPAALINVGHRNVETKPCTTISVAPFVVFAR